MFFIGHLNSKIIYKHKKILQKMKDSVFLYSSPIYFFKEALDDSFATGFVSLVAVAAGAFGF